jgi:hypothetical protein
MKPKKGDFSDYYKHYIDLVEHDNHMAALQDNHERIVKFLKKLPKKKRDFRYDEGKWSPKEILIHLLDAERVFAYRALRFSRGDETELPGYDHDSYVEPAQADKRKWKSIIKEYSAVRNATLALFGNIPEESLDRGGVCSGARQTVRAIGYIIAGHELHHMRVIQEKYL